MALGHLISPSSIWQIILWYFPCFWFNTLNLLRQVLGIEIIFALAPPKDSPYYEIFEHSQTSTAHVVSILGRDGSRRGQREISLQGFMGFGGKAKYGYMIKSEVVGRRKNKEMCRTKLVSNPETFHIAKEILERRAKGETCYHIAKDLERRKILTPSAWDSYGNLLESEKCDWKPSGVQSICDDAEWTYLGHYVGNRSNPRIKYGEYRGSYFGRKARRPKSEWIIFRNAHELCISRETAEKIVSLRNMKSRQHRQPSKVHLFTIECFCGGRFI